MMSSSERQSLLQLGDTGSRLIEKLGPPTLKEVGTGLDVDGLPYDLAMTTAPLGREYWQYSNADPMLSIGVYLSADRLTAVTFHFEP
jgi:hypothetical protein